MIMGGVNKMIEIVGCSEISWEDAAKTAIGTASKTLKDLRIAEVTMQDITIKDNRIDQYRVRLKVSFKYHPGE